MLVNASTCVKPGGRLFYVVCTLTHAETVGVVEAFSRQTRGFEPLPLPDLLNPQEPPAPYRTLWPERTGGNGMFIAAWRKPAPPAPPPEPGSEAPTPAAPI